MKLHARVVCLLFLLLFPMLASAQDIEPTPRQTLLDAFNQFQTMGHHIEFEVSYDQNFIEEDETTAFEVHMRQSGSADFNANGDYSITLFISTAELEALESIEPYQLNRMKVNDIAYIEIPPPNETYPFGVLDAAPGWWEESALLDQADEYSAQRIALEQFVKSTIPGQEPLQPAMIRRVIEAEPETLNGIEMRVFVVELNPIAVMLSNTVVTNLEETLRQTAQALGMSLLADLDYQQKFWIGAEDGLLYHATSEYHGYFPYRSMGFGGVDYDMEITGSSLFTVSNHGQDVEISLPSAAELNR